MIFVMITVDVHGVFFPGVFHKMIPSFKRCLLHDRNSITNFRSSWLTVPACSDWSRFVERQAPEPDGPRPDEEIGYLPEKGPAALMRHVAEFVPRQTERDELDDSRSGEDASKCMPRLMADDTGCHEIDIRTPKAAIPIPAKPLACKPHHRRQREHAAEENDDLEHRPLYC